MRKARYKNFISFGIGILLALVIFLPSTTSATESFSSVDQYFEVTSDRLTIYDNSSGSLVPVGTLHKGQIFKRISGMGNWHKVQFGGKYGYIWGPATVPATEPAELKWSEGTSHPNTGIAFKTLTVYDNSTGKLVPFATILQGNEFKYVRQSGNWMIVEISGRKGYVYAPAVSFPFKSTDRYFKVLTDNLTVYDNSTGKLVAVGTLPKGQVYKRTRDIGNWHEIEYASGKGYVWEASTTPASSNEVKNWTNGGTYVQEIVGMTDLSVYDNTSGSLVPFAKITKGHKIKHIHKSGNWLIVEVGGRKGYIYEPATKRPFKSMDKFFEVLEENLTIYDNSTGSLVAVGTLKKGQVFKRTADVGNWHEISYGTGKMYVWEDSTRPVDVSNVSNPNPGKPFKEEKIVLGQDVPVYDNSKNELVQFATLKKGQLLQITGMAGSNWYEIDLGGRLGYIYVTGVEKNMQTIYEEYNKDFNNLVNLQMNYSPKADGAGNIYASREAVEYYMNPNNFSVSTTDFFQFLVLSRNANLHAAEINEKVLSGKGIFEGRAEAFIEAGQKYNINEVYLIAHALHETGNGTSTLAQGVSVNGTTVYNMYGIRAYDATPVSSGSNFAYQKGWFTPEAAIVGGAKFIADSYINSGQDTLYKMKWDPEDIDTRDRKQYATHVSWAVLQTSRIKDIYDMLENYVIVFEVPKYLNQPGATAKPTGEALYLLDTTKAGKIGVTTDNLNMRTGPSTSFSKITTLPLGTPIEVIGSNGSWLKIKANGQVGWVIDTYVTFTDGAPTTPEPAPSVDVLTVVNTEGVGLNVRSTTDTSSSANIMGKVYEGDILDGVKDASGNYVKDTTGKWYQINFQDQQGWVHGDYVQVTSN
ncbi:SH3 domain-containing protein [Bacillaceae bacterium S4-13-58]